MYCPLSTQPIFNNGALAYGAGILAFDTGTTTPRALFSTSSLDPTRQLPRPVPVNADGTAPVMYAGVGDYDLQIVDRSGAQFRFIPGLPGDPKPATGGGTTFDPLRQIPTGAALSFYGTGRQSGFVRCNGLRIGSSASDADERNDDDTAALFALAWNQGAAAVIGGRGQSAAADFSANKTIVLPNAQNRALVGITDMGNAGAAASLAGSAASSITVGSVGGEAVHQLGLAEIPGHVHPASFSGNGVGPHQHDGATGNPNQPHNHGVYVKPVQFFNGQSNAGTVTLYVPAAPADGSTLVYPTAPDNQQQTHNFTTNPNGGFTPSGSVGIGNAGSDGTHNNLQPFIGFMLYLKL